MDTIVEIAFDFDGVFADTTMLCAKEIQIIGEELTGRCLDLETILSGWGTTFEEYLRRFYPGITLDMYLEVSCRLGFDKRLPPRVVGARRAIEILGRSYPLSIITNRGRETLEKILDGLEIDRRKFRYIQSCSDTPFHKPDPRVFQKYWEAMADGRISPSQVLYVGDHLVDHQAASARGFRFVGVLSGLATTRQDFLDAGVPAESILESVWDLPRHMGVA